MMELIERVQVRGLEGEGVGDVPRQDRGAIQRPLGSMCIPSRCAFQTQQPPTVEAAGLLFFQHAWHQHHWQLIIEY
jgi:hypothetical protein